MRKRTWIGAVSAAAICMAPSTSFGTGWRVVELNGAPGLHHDGKPVAAMLFWQWEPQEKDAKDMSAAGVHVYTDSDVVLSANSAWLMMLG